MMERRVFLAGVSAAVAGTAVSSPIGPLTEAQAAHAPTRALFAGLLGSGFRIYDRDGRFMDSARLTAIEDGPCCSQLDQFSLVFESARTEALPERIFRLTGGNGEVMDLALTPVTGLAKHHRAIFSLLVRA